MEYKGIDDSDNLPSVNELEYAASPRIGLLQQLAQVDMDNNAYLATLTDKQSLLGSFLKGLNRKVELLTRFVIESLESEKSELQEVDISGGGIRFTSHHAVKIDQHIRLEIVLVPECYGLICCARVVDMRPTDVEGIFEIACIFTRLRESDRDAIIRHVFNAQSRQLRHTHHMETREEEAQSASENS